MKCTPVLLFFCLCWISCSNERGALEIESLSKRVFDTLKSNDFGKFRDILPNKNDYEKLLTMKGTQTDGEIDLLYKQYVLKCEEDFKHIRERSIDWAAAAYANTNDEVNKVENVTKSVITTKFKIDDAVYKLTFTGEKVNGRWYYVDDLQWMANDSSSVQ